MIIFLIILGIITAIGAYLLFVEVPRSPLDPPWGDERREEP